MNVNNLFHVKISNNIDVFSNMINILKQMPNESNNNILHMKITCPEINDKTIYMTTCNKNIIIKIKLIRESFCEFYCDSSELKFSVNLQIFCDCLKNINQNNNLIMYIEKYDEKLTVEINNEHSGTKSVHKLDINIDDVETKHKIIEVK